MTQVLLGLVAALLLGLLIAGFTIYDEQNDGQSPPVTIVVEAPPTTVAPFCERWHC